MNKVYDALIVGGGPAGLSVALGLGRVHRTCVIFSDSRYRNQGAHAAHAILGLDYTPPEVIRSQGRQQVEHYRNTEFVDASIARLITDRRSYDTEMFVAEAEDGKRWTGRTVVLATGATDLFPDLPGYRENWPHNIYQCLFCDGHERSHLPAGILAYPTFHPMLAKMATMAHFLSLPPGSSQPDNPNTPPLTSLPPESKVTLFTNGPLKPDSDPAVAEALETCAAFGIQIDERPVVKLVDATPSATSTDTSSHENHASDEGGVEVHLRNHDSTTSPVKMGYVFHKPPATLSSQHLIEQLALDLTPPNPFGHPAIATVNQFNMTSRPGVFVAGDAKSPIPHVTQAMATGMAVAGGVAAWCAELCEGEARERMRRRGIPVIGDGVEAASTSTATAAVAVGGANNSSLSGTGTTR